MLGEKNSPVVYKKAASPTGLIHLRRPSFQAKLPTEEEFKSHALVVVIKRETDEKKKDILRENLF